jgi:hypothetical protein
MNINEQTRLLEVKSSSFYAVRGQYEGNQPGLVARITSPLTSRFATYRLGAEMGSVAMTTSYLH